MEISKKESTELVEYLKVQIFMAANELAVQIAKSKWMSEKEVSDMFGYKNPQFVALRKYAATNKFIMKEVGRTRLYLRSEIESHIESKAIVV